MKARNKNLISILFFLFALHLVGSPTFGESGKAPVVKSSPGWGPILAQKFRLNEFLDALTGKGSKKDSASDSEQQKKREKSKGERTLDIIQGLGAILSSSQEMGYKSERTIGESLALEVFRRFGMPVNDPALQKYVNLVGVAVARNSLRPGIPYRFVVIRSPLQNAFACPGGIIFISSALMKTVQTEAQLASVLAHEVAHVGHKHALQSIKRAQFFQGIGKITAATMKGEKGQQFASMIGDLQTVLFDRGLDQNMEFEGDATAMETAYRAGYNPRGMIEVLQALKRLEADSQKRGSWFSTHPPLNARIQKTRNQLGAYRDWSSMAQLTDRYSIHRQRIN